ncbi:MAG: hypothetical protein IJA63_11265 [Akkermansia sp.]|nr:hypothetical protein [Akkermansia sp.]
MNKNRIEGQSARGEAAMDAHARYSVKSAHGKSGLHCVKAACLILRDPAKA